MSLAAGPMPPRSWTEALLRTPPRDSRRSPGQAICVPRPGPSASIGVLGGFARVCKLAVCHAATAMSVCEQISTTIWGLALVGQIWHSMLVFTKIPRCVLAKVPPHPPQTWYLLKIVFLDCGDLSERWYSWIIHNIRKVF